MEKVKYVYIPIGGIGERLKAEIPELTYSSKCFLTFRNKSLLMRIVEECKEYCSEIVIVYCYEQQYQDAYGLLGNNYQGMRVHYVKNDGTDPYVCMPKDGDCLAIMGDSYVCPEVFDKFMDYIAKDRILSFLKLYSSKINQSIGFYKCNGDYIYDWSSSEAKGYEYFEIGQLLYFPEEIVEDAIVQCKKTDALAMLRYFIKKLDKVGCYELPCYNINNKVEYDTVAEILSSEGGIDGICCNGNF